MPKDIIVLVDGRDLLGAIQDASWTINDSITGQVVSDRSKIARVEFRYDGTPGHDKITLTDLTELSGEVANKSVNIVLDSNKQKATIDTKNVTYIRFNFSVDG